jgi:hypothetical protein
VARLRDATNERIATLESENAELKRKLEAANCPVGWGDHLR